MQQLKLIFLLFLFACKGQAHNDPLVRRYEAQAARVTIIRDTWGIPHVYGKTNADAVFGLMYAQCEANFEKVERAYIEKLGRLAEVDGPKNLYQDLLTRLIADTATAIKQYRESPSWMKSLLQAFADGINYYLYKNPETKPARLIHFEPWYPLLFTDGAYVSLKTGGLEFEDMRRMYPFDANSSFTEIIKAADFKGSNGFAIAPSKTIDKKALLYINPHVSFDFRMEAQIVSEEGLNVYGAVTWGQFFIYQGFNEQCGWMHTSSMADAADLYEYELLQKDGSLLTLYDGALKPVAQKEFIFSYKKGTSLTEQKLNVYYTHHGPVVGKNSTGKLVSLKILPPSLNGLMQSWQRMEAKGLTDFKKTMRLYNNATTNTVYADAKGAIAYWHGDFIPKRDSSLNWSMPVDGSTSATAWQGAHDLDEIIYIENPSQGFIQNCNSSPFNVSGMNSIDSKQYPAYMAPDGENFRSQLAIKELEKEKAFTIDKLIALGYNHYLGAFDSLLPPLFNAYKNLSPGDVLQTDLKEPISLLQGWDRMSGATSSATTLAIEWAYYLMQKESIQLSEEQASHQIIWMTAAVKNTSPQKLLSYLKDAVSILQNSYGTWRVPWGEINRYQRTAKGKNHDDNEASLPVGMASALFGSLPAYEVAWTNTGKGYGYAGNSFVAVVEFGERVRAKAVVPGGQSFDPSSKHFNDQAELYINEKLREVFFYREDVERNKERVYRPGE